MIISRRYMMFCSTHDVNSQHGVLQRHGSQIYFLEPHMEGEEGPERPQGAALRHESLSRCTFLYRSLARPHTLREVIIGR